MLDKKIRRVRNLTTFLSVIGFWQSLSMEGLKAKYLSANPKLILTSNISITTSHAISMFTRIHHDY